MQLVTGYTGTKHVSAQDDSIRNVMLGEFNGRGVFPVFNEFEATAVTANEVRVSSGYGINQGRLFKIDRNDYDSCTIENGAAGYKRVDLIVARYLKDGHTGIESCKLVVIKGTPSSEGYVDPTYTTGNLLTGALQDDMPMYRVKINGVAIEAVEQMFEKYESLIGGIDKRIYAMTEEQFDDKLGKNQQRFEDWFASVQEYLEGDIAMELTNAVGSHNAALGAFNNNITDGDGNVSGLGILPVSHGGTGVATSSALQQLIGNLMYPVGSIYMSTSSTNPSSKFGGTWVNWGSGKVPVGVNTNETEFNTVEKTGGAKSHSYTPSGTNSGGVVQGTKLSVNQMPVHTHTFTGNASSHYHELNNHKHYVYGKYGDSFGTGVRSIKTVDDNAWVNDDSDNLSGSSYNATQIGYNKNLGSGHTQSEVGYITDYGIGASSSSTSWCTQNESIKPTGSNSNTGGGQSHSHSLTQPTFTGTASTQSHLQPYITCYMWKRTA